MSDGRLVVLGAMNCAYNHSCEDMSEIPDGAVQTCVSSPPYYHLRDYGVDGQIGLESTVEEYVARLVRVYREVHRVLRDDGTAWVNLGDCYATGRGDGKPKDLIGIPWRVAFALRDDGWYLRDAIVWSKANPLPSSVSDRCTPCYEFIFMLAKNARYYADMDSVRTPLTASTLARVSQVTYDRQAGSLRANGGAKPNGPMKTVLKKQDGAGNRQYTGFNERYDRAANALGANLRNVWDISTKPYTDAHFATFPLELAQRCIRIGSRIGDLVLDPFLGSGTTAEAAESLGRRWVGYELNPEYLPLIAKRTVQAGLFSTATDIGA